MTKRSRAEAQRTQRRECWIQKELLDSTPIQTKPALRQTAKIPAHEPSEQYSFCSLLPVRPHFLHLTLMMSAKKIYLQIQKFAPFRFIAPSLYIILVISSIVSMMGDSTAFRAVPSITLTIPWSIILMFPFAAFEFITKIDIFKSEVPGTIIISVSAILNSAVLFFVFRAFDRRLSCLTPPPIPKV